MTPRRLLLASVLSLSATGCAWLGAIEINGKPIGGPGKAQFARMYEGPECASMELYTQHEQRKRGSRHPDDAPGTPMTHDHPSETFPVVYAPQPDPSASFAEQAAHVACGERLSSYSSKVPTPAVLHERFDDYAFDHAAAATILASCERMESCLFRVDPAEATQHQRWVAGLLSFYAANVDRAKVEEALDSAGVSAGLEAVFMKRFDTGLASVVAVAETIPEAERAAFLEVPAAVREETEAAYQTHNERWKNLRALRDKAEAERVDGVSDDTIASLSALRADYVDACGGKPSCMHDGLPAAIAHELFLAYVSRGDAAGAYTEMDFVEPTGEHGLPAAHEIYRRQSELFRRSTAAADKLQDAKKRGLDARTAQAAAGAGAYDFSETRPWAIDEAPGVQYAAVVPGQVHKASGKVKTTKKAGEGRTTIVFADKVTRWDDMDCRDTSKIERVHADGRIDYKQRCRKTGKVNVDRRTFDPVEVPTPEAAKLVAGDEVVLWVVPGQTKVGRVRWVRRKDRVVQIRDVKVKGEKAKT